MFFSKKIKIILMLVIALVSAVVLVYAIAHKPIEKQKEEMTVKDFFTKPPSAAEKKEIKNFFTLPDPPKADNSPLPRAGS